MNDENYTNYTSDINNEIEKIKEYAYLNKVPIIKDEGLEELLNVIKKNNSKKILEIGSAIGYSAIVMTLSSKEIDKIDTIERDHLMIEVAKKNIQKLKLESKIIIYENDALDLDISILENEYDLIFIDAAKAQYKKFFEKFTPLLKKRGIVFTDNLLFHGLVEKYENNELSNVSKNLFSLVKKISQYNKWLKENKEYETLFLSIGDGIAVSRKL